MSTTNQVEKIGGEAMKDASKVASQATENIQEKATKALDYTKKNYQALLESVKDNPLTSVLVASAVGWFLASYSGGKK